MTPSTPIHALVYCRLQITNWNPDLLRRQLANKAMHASRRSAASVNHSFLAATAWAVPTAVSLTCWGRYPRILRRDRNGSRDPGDRPQVRSPEMA